MMNFALAARSSRTALALIALAAAVSCDAQSEEKTCDLLSISECSSRPYCAIKHAQHANTDEQCLAPAQPIACTDLKQVCDDALTLARDEFDQLYVLPNTCIPAGWEGEDDPEGEIVNWPACE